MRSYFAPFFLAAVIAEYPRRENHHYKPTIDLVSWQSDRSGAAAASISTVSRSTGTTGAVSLNGRAIVPVERSELRCACPTGYTMNGDRCEHTSRSAPEAICPLGYTAFDANTCIKQTFPEEKCNFGFARVGNDCIRRDVVIPELTCPVGYEFESTASFSPSPALDELICLKRIAVETELECPDGTSFSSQCTSTRNVEPLHHCPAGYTPGPANTCSRTEEVECGPTSSHPRLRRLSVEDHLAAAKTHTADKWKLWGSGKETRIAPRSQVLRVQQTCTADITIPATPYCETGQLRGQLCAEQVPVDPVRVCPAFGTVTDCYAFDRLNPRSTCPTGFHEECAVAAFSVNCECIRTSMEAINLFCPAGAELVDGLCTITARPFVGCATGSELVDGACEETEYATPICTYNVEFACQGLGCDSAV